MASSGKIMLTTETIESFGLKISSTIADNSTQFRAFAIHDFGLEVGHSSVRSHLVAHMRENRSDYVHLMDIKLGDILRRNPSRSSRINSPATATQDYVDGVYNSYLTKMAAEEYPGDRITLNALAAYFYTDVLIIRSNGCEIVRATEDRCTKYMWAFTHNKETGQWTAVEGDCKTSIKELVAALPRQNFIGDFSQSSTSSSSNGSGTSATSGGETPKTANTTPNTTPKRPEVASSMSSEKLMTFNSIYPALPTTTLGHRHLVARPVKTLTHPPRRTTAPGTSQPATSFTTRTSIDPIQELDDELFDEHLAKAQPRKQYIKPKVQSNNELASQKRKLSEEDLCFAKKKKTNARTSTCPTPVAKPGMTASKDVNTVSAGVKRAAPADENTESSTVKKQKVDESIAILKTARTPFGRLVEKPKTPSKAIHKPFTPVIQRAVQKKTTTSTTKAETSSAAPVAPTLITKKRTTFLFGAKSSIPTIARTYRTERILDAPKPEPIRITTHEKVGPPATPSKPAATAKKNMTAPAKLPLPKGTVSMEKPATLINAFTKIPSEKKIPATQYGLKPIHTRSDEPTVVGPGVVAINAPIPIFDFVPSKETKDEREERLSKLSGLERRKQESKERTQMLAYNTQNRSERKLFATAKSV